MMGLAMKQKLKTGDEVDCICARHMYKFLEHAGVASRIKRGLRRRMRRDAKKVIEEQIDE
mgnify:CR=1 FL=1